METSLLPSLQVTTIAIVNIISNRINTYSMGEGLVQLVSHSYNLQYRILMYNINVKKHRKWWILRSLDSIEGVVN